VAATVDDGPKAERSHDVENLKRIGKWHAAAVLAALTLFGAAHTWAEVSHWLLAGVVSIGTAVLAAMVLSSIAHEWGHFSAARLSGAVAPVLRKPYQLYFMFKFDMAANSVRQALWMSWGGISASWLLVVLLFLMVPMDSWASAVLVGTAFGRAVNATAFEFPVIVRTQRSGAFEKELNTQLETTGIMKLPGLLAGVLAIVALG